LPKSSGGQWASRFENGGAARKLDGSEEKWRKVKQLERLIFDPFSAKRTRRAEDIRHHFGIKRQPRAVRRISGKRHCAFRAKPVGSGFCSILENRSRIVGGEDPLKKICESDGPNSTTAKLSHGLLCG
jgi:hypothetical protein